MKINVVKLFIATLVLSTVAMAADRTKGTFMDHATIGMYTYYSSPPYVSIILEADRHKSPSGGELAIFVIIIDDYATGHSLFGLGNIPVAMITVTGNSGNILVVNIPDLRQLGPDFLIVSESGFFSADPLVVNLTLTETSSLTSDYTVTTRLRTPQPDGTISMETYLQSYTETSADVNGNLVGYSLPLPTQGDVSDQTAYLRQGNYYKDHLVP